MTYHPDLIAAIRAVLQAEGAPRVAVWLVARAGLSPSHGVGLLRSLASQGLLQAAQVQRPSRRGTQLAIALPEDQAPDWTAAAAHYAASYAHDAEATLATRD